MRGTTNDRRITVKEVRVDGFTVRLRDEHSRRKRRSTKWLRKKGQNGAIIIDEPSEKG